MHSRDKGKSRSTKPINKEVPSWVSYKPAEVEKLVEKLGKQGNTASKIGIILRDSYGIPSVKVITKKTITTILSENKLTKEVPEEMVSLLIKAVKLRDHIKDNHNDKTSKRGLNLTESKIKRLGKYLIKAKKLPADWRYDPEKAKLFIE